MKRGVKIILSGSAAALIAVAVAAGWLFSKAMPIGTGYVAKYLCSSTFISGRNPDDRRWPAAPGDAFAALGFQEQKVIVIPSRKLVLVRFGATADRKSWNTDEFIRNILACLPN